MTYVNFYINEGLNIFLLNLKLIDERLYFSII